jgi:hypothetical protein
VLPQVADLADLYRALRQEIDARFSLKGFESDLQVFNSLSMERRAAEIAINLGHFKNLGQAVTIVTANGIFEEIGILKPWAPVLFAALGANRTSKLCIVSNRQIHENEILHHRNVVQFAVPPLQDDDIRALMIATTSAFGSQPQLPRPGVIRAIGGHPGIAKAASDYSRPRRVRQIWTRFSRRSRRPIFGALHDGRSISKARRVLAKQWSPRLPCGDARE